MQASEASLHAQNVSLVVYGTFDKVKKLAYWRFKGLHVNRAFWLGAYKHSAQAQVKEWSARVSILAAALTTHAHTPKSNYVYTYVLICCMHL